MLIHLLENDSGTASGPVPGPELHAYAATSDTLYRESTDHDGTMAQTPLIKKIVRSNPFVALLLALAVFVIIYGLRQTGALQGLELAAYDYQLRQQVQDDTPSPLVVQVKISEQDIQRLKEWPLSDQSLGALLRRIHDMGASVIGVDIYRDHPVPPGSDEFNRTIHGMENLIMVEKRGHDAGTLIGPPPALQGTDRIGFTDMVMDDDGYVRRGLLYMDDGENYFFSLSLKIVMHYLGSQGIYPQQDEENPEWMKLGSTTYRPFEGNDGGYTDSDAGGYQYLLNFRDGPSAFPTFTLQEVMDDSFPADRMQEKIVLVGVDADSVKDRFMVPIASEQDGKQGLPGMQVHAHAIAQLIKAAGGEDQPPVIIEQQWETLSIGLLAVVGVLAGLLLRRLIFFIPVLVGMWGVLFFVAQAGYSAGYWLPLVPASLAWILSSLLMTAYLSGSERMQKRFLMDLFARHVSKDVANEIWRQRDQFLEGGRLDPKKMPVTILFSDLAGFTPVAEALPPEKLIDWLNNYMDIMAGLVMQHGGVVDDYYGDAIKANFGVPAQRDNDADIADDAAAAIHCALSMREAMRTLNADLAARDLPPVKMRVGLATGSVIAGCLGSSERMKYTTLGDTVNTAARLEAYGKEVEWQEGDDDLCRIMVASTTMKRVSERFKHRLVGELALKGKSETVTVYTIEGAASGSIEGEHR